MKLPPEVVAALAAAKITGVPAIGQRLTMPVVGRKVYLKADEALNAIGGRWSRSAKAHVFPVGIDARAAINAAVGTASVVTHKDEGFFPTPPALASEIAAVAAAHFVNDRPRRFAEDRPLRILEPSVGDGRLLVPVLLALAEALPGVPFSLSLCETNAARRSAALAAIDGLPPSVCYRVHTVGTGGDFLSTPCDRLLPGGKPADLVVMNPPFRRGKSGHVDHLARASSYLAPGGKLISVLPAGTWAGLSKGPMKIPHLNGYARPLPDGTFADAGTGVRTELLTLKDHRAPDNAARPEPEPCPCGCAESGTCACEIQLGLRSPRVKLPPPRRSTTRAV